MVKTKTKGQKKLQIPKISEKTFIIAGLVVIVAAFFLFNGSLTGKVSKATAGENAVNFLNEYFSQNSAEGKVELISVKEVSGLYEVSMLYESEPLIVYVTTDGEYIMPKDALAPMIITGQQQTSNQQQQEQAAYTADDIEKLREFSECLAEKEVKIYGANWCGWTKKLVVETLGGFDIASAAYVECTENVELCQSEGVQGYPTIKINGKVYTGDRTIEALAKETGCPVPDLEGNSGSGSSSGSEGSCG